MSVEQLPPPLKRYLLGAYPSHTSRKGLAQSFEGVTADLLNELLLAGGFVTEDGKTAQKAAEAGLLASCEGKLLWDVQAVQTVLSKQGMKLTRIPQNQNLEQPVSMEPVWVNLGTLATYFSVTANQVGKWLDELGHREDGEPTEEAIKGGLATFVEMNAGGKKTRKVTHWNLHPVKTLLVDNGHVLNFDYEGSMRGKGRNKDVEVVGTMDERAREFATEFARMFKDGKTRKNCPALVQRTPKAILVRAEGLLKKPGFLTTGKFKEYI